MHNKTYIKQSKDSPYCGPYSLWIANQLFKGEYKSPKSLINLCRTTQKWGTEDEEMIEAAQKMGYHVDEVCIYKDLHLPTLEGIFLLCYRDTPKTGHWAACTYATNSRLHDDRVHVILKDPYYGDDFYRILKKDDIISMYTLRPMWWR